MHRTIWLFQLCAVLPSLVCALISSALQIHENVDRVPFGWYQALSDPCPTQRIKIHIVIRQEEKHALLQDQLLGVSTPGHRLYGQHCDHEELNSMLRPDPAVSSGLLHWFRSAGIPDHEIQAQQDWINIQTTIKHAEHLLDAKFHYYHNLNPNIPPVVRTLQYSVPRHLHQHIQMVQPTTHFSRVRPFQDFLNHPPPVQVYGSPTKLNTTYCTSTLSPDCVRALYNIGTFKPNATSEVKLGISAFNYEIAVHKDLQLFLNKYAPAENRSTFAVKTSNGGKNNESDVQVWASEANLDVQVGVSLAENIPVTLLKTGGYGPLVPDLQQPAEPGNLLVQEPFLAHLEYLLNMKDAELPTVLSISYGEDEQSHPVSFMTSVCQAFMKLGARGVSVIVSSGDGGPGDGCMTNDGKNKTRFQPQFPASCPWVTSVGGTMNIPEKAWYSSGGGFSDVFARPEYQSQQIGKYLNDTVGKVFSGLYNRSGRGIPDVSAQADTTWPIFHMGQEQYTGGTSAATPAWAAIIANLNAARISKGQKPLGFLNPWLYSNAAGGLNDIKNGRSTGCFNVTLTTGDDAPPVPGAGWNASKGWDAVTGLGTPNFGKLLDIATK